MFRGSRLVVLSGVLIGAVVGGSAPAAEPVAGAPAQTAPQQIAYKSVLTPQQVSAEIADPNVIVIDVRDADAYAKGHLPGAINLPGKAWRTPSSNPQEKLGQYIFRNEAGELDVARYEKLLSDAGVNTGQRVIVYGSHAGKADGSTPVAILLLLGHENVGFLDGNGAAEWEKAGFSLETTPNTRPAGTFVARPQPREALEPRPGQAGGRVEQRVLLRRPLEGRVRRHRPSRQPSRRAHPRRGQPRLRSPARQAVQDHPPRRPGPGKTLDTQPPDR